MDGVKSSTTVMDRIILVLILIQCLGYCLATEETCAPGLYGLTTCTTPCPARCLEPLCAVRSGQCAACGERRLGAWCDVIEDIDGATISGYNESSIEKYVPAKAYPNIFMNLTFNTSGLVTSVTAYGAQAGPVVVAAWRNETGGWTLVAKEVIQLVKGEKTYKLTNPLFYVNASDALGYHYENDRDDKRGAPKLLKKNGKYEFFNLHRSVWDQDLPLGVTTRDLAESDTKNVIYKAPGSKLRMVGFKATIKPLDQGHCPPGIYLTPSGCTQTCTPGHFGSNCSGQCVRCLHQHCTAVNGRCLSGCIPGYTSDFCQDACPAGSYGPGCASTCSPNCDGVCDHVTGHCPQCSPGWTGDFCRNKCPAGQFGADCASTCGHCDCHHVTGKCTSSCEAGWRGELCYDKCPAGRYGQSCSRECGHCDCDHVTGLCDVCDAGWQGERCTEACSIYEFGANCSSSCGRCLGGAPCDHVTGHCPRVVPRCQDGWQGQICDKPCRAGTYGPSCARTCHYCSDQTSCDHETGACSPCQAGWTGGRCHEPCPRGWYGVNCSQQCDAACESCDHMSGSCEQCAPGFRGDQCSEKCSNGTFGTGCREVCGNCSNNTVCDHESGNCPQAVPRCSPGSTGLQCLQACTLGFYGEDCGFPCPSGCSAGCNIINGRCPSSHLNTLAPESLQSSPHTGLPQRWMWLIGGIAGAVVVLLAITAAVVVVVKRKTRSRQPSMTAEYKARPLTPDDMETTDDYVMQPLVPKVDVVEETEQEQVYENALPSNAIPVENLYQHIIRAREDDEPFQAEYTRIPSGQTAKWDCGKRAEVSGKNRFKNILPYDFNRVLLKEQHGPGSDYINASFVSGLDGKTYIASHGPMKKTIDDFWQMVWEYEVTTIVMLTGLVEDMKPKCDKYWPSDGVSVYGQVTVMPETEEVWPDVTIRVFSVTSGRERRPLRHYQYTTWPDHGVPDHAGPLLRLRTRVRRESLGGGLIIHCSAGVGRTGTFIALDCLLEEAEVAGKVDVLGTAVRLRNARINMIQTLDQYIFLYDALNEALSFGPTCLPCHCFHDRLSELQRTDDRGLNQLQKQFQFLEKAKPVFFPEEFQEALVNLEKNRDLDVLPAEKHRVFLVTPGLSSYINAVPVKGYRKTRAYYLTQFPLESTVADFWGLVEMLQLNCIVCLGFAKDCPQWLPTEELPVCLGPTTVRLAHPPMTDSITIHEVVVETRPLTSSLNVCVLHLSDLDPVGIADIHQSATTWQRRNGDSPTLVVCPNGADLCGLYVCTSILLDMANTEQEVDVFQVVKQARSSRPQLIASQEQYNFLFEGISQYIEDFGNYSNFK